MELFLKVAVSIICFIFLVWMWKSHIDVRETVVNFFKNKVEWISTRQENAIYQNNKLVGNISGDVKEEGEKYIFDELYDTELLDINQPFEYKRNKYKITHIQIISGSASTPRTQRSSVLKGVTCEKTSN